MATPTLLRTPFPCNHNKRMCCVTPPNEENSRLSKLPDYLVESILERLPVHDAVRTSILSRDWRYKWTTMRSLVLDKHFSEKLPYTCRFYRDGFNKITNQLFNFLKGPILKLHLHIPKMTLDNTAQELHQWILSLSSVRELVLTNLNSSYQLSSSLFHCSQLRKLQLTRFKFNSPLEFQGFLYLEHLSLERINFGANLCETVINLPQLKSLKLIICQHVNNFNISATKLKSLRVIGCETDMLLRLLHTQSLTTVHFAMLMPMLFERGLNLATIFCNLPYHLASLSMDGYFLKFSMPEENSKKWFPHAANRLKRLTLIEWNFGDLDQLEGALYMLRNSTNLVRLDMTNLAMAPENMHLDVRPALTYLEASDPFDQTLTLLKTIIIKCVTGSRPILLFIKLLLDHCPALEKISIKYCATVGVHERYNFAKDVTSFPRASSKAELIFLDP
ncbi:F-box/FBD/LRR-repeat protein At1g13570-like [Rutidosis leptorrhynchoides]|uniref:F-box/FBD/LRR-repeat protein At1g13570-like n=1 Tax=Rutidosis leptorrhynchoides TaxID=125765 RepID=UPI003A9A5E9D